MLTILVGLAALVLAVLPEKEPVGTADGGRGEGAEGRGVVGVRLGSFGGPPLGLPGASAARDLGPSLEAFYRSRGGTAAWFAEGWLGRMKPKAETWAFLERAKEAERDGEVREGSLAVGDLTRALEDLDPEDLDRLAEIDAAVSWTALHLLSQLALGPVLPAEAGIAWDVPLRQVDLAGALTDVVEGRVDDLHRRVGPANPRYWKLVTARNRYARIVEAGGWPRVPGGDALEIGANGDPRRLRALRERLEAEGFLDEGAARDEPVYDRALSDAVGRFQATRTLDVDGKLGPRTLEELNVTAEERLAQIELNLTRWRWVPDAIWRNAVVVNIPGYHLWRYVDGEPRLDMGVVVGKPDWPTPIFSDQIRYLVLNPAWNVPASIVRDEILPELDEDPDYLDENNMAVLEGWGEEAREVPPSRIRELAAASGPTPLHVQQRPGPTNPLGTIKFIFPNENSVYLHDTAARSLFSEADRNLSHGCVRVAEPYALAADLMRDEGWTEREVRDRIAHGGAEEHVPLPETVPVYLLYWTAEVRPEGDLHFYEDIYGIDRAQRKALGS